MPLAAAGAGACMGRRLQRSKKIKNLEGSLEEAVLYTSEGTAEEVQREEEEEEEEKKKFYFRLWRTASTTATITSYSTNRSVTVSASVMCTYPGITLNFC